MEEVDWKREARRSTRYAGRKRTEGGEGTGTGGGRE